MVLALVGGALADAFDRRKLIFGAELASGVHLRRAAGQRAAAVAAAVGALRGGGAVRGAQRRAAPTAGRADAAARGARRAQGGERDPLVAGERLAQIVGPALAGVVIAGGGRETAYAIDVGRSCSRSTAFALMRTPPPPPTRSRRPCAAWSRAAVRRLAPGAPRLLRDRHERDVLRDAVRAVPGVRRALRRDRGGRPAVGGARGRRDRRHAHRGWASRVHHNGRAIVFAAAAWGAFIALRARRTRSGSRCSRSRSRARRTASAASSAARCGTRRSRTGCAGASRAWR